MTDDASNTPKADAATATALAELSGVMHTLLGQTGAALAAKGVDPDTLAPLQKLGRAVQALQHLAAAVRPQPVRGLPAVIASGSDGAAVPPRLPRGEDKRGENVEASDEVLARASAIIDVLVQAGHTPEHAAQVITRQLLSVGVELPEAGGDARAWKRLFNWRNRLIHHSRSGPAWYVYCKFRDELAHIPPDQRLRHAIGEKLWDRRKDSAPLQDIA